jgi:hypothetical protein
LNDPSVNGDLPSLRAAGWALLNDSAKFNGIRNDSTINRVYDR